MTALRTTCLPPARAATLLAPLALAFCASPSFAADDLAGALAGGKPSLEFRYRFDHVENDACGSISPVCRNPNANASTLRTRLNYTTAAVHDTTGFVEMDNVSRIGDDRYNDGRNGKLTYPVVPDPDGTDLNQAWLRYAGIDKTTVTVGRQRVAFDNHRVIGFTPGRQNEQTLDGALVEFKGIERLTANLGYLTRVNTSSGPEPATAATQSPHERDLSLPLAHIRYEFADALSLAAYHFATDFERDAFASQALSQATSGLRAGGKVAFGGELGIEYVAEAAQQSDHAGQNTAYDAGYRYGDLKLNVGKNFYVGLAHETLESDNGMRFITPLATLKFHGFAEKFWQTPAGGIEDTWVTIGGNVAGWRLMLKQHWLQQQTDIENNGSEFGEETNFTAFRAFGKHYQVLFVHALFDVRHGSYTNAALPGRFDDTTKTYLALTAKY